MRKNLGFRAWLYFRQGYGTYFAIILATINTLVVTYYLAIKEVPILKEIFPAFLNYVVIMSAIGIPLLVMAGYLHFKRTAAYSAELDIQYESNQFLYKIPPGFNKEVVFPLYLMLSKMMIKWSKNEKLSDEEINEITELQKKIDVLLKGGYVGKPQK